MDLSKRRCPSPKSISNLEVRYDLGAVREILTRTNNRKTYEIRNVSTNVIDHFLYSGRFNSVLGPEGFSIFKEKMKDVIKRVNDEDFGLNYINLDEMFEALLDSGVYYVEEYIPSDLEILKTDQRWLTTYRYIASNFPGISIADFRVIRNRFEETKGYSFYIESDDSAFLQNLTIHW